jgi:hypothetical protein
MEKLFLKNYNTESKILYSVREDSWKAAAALTRNNCRYLGGIATAFYGKKVIA